MGEMNIAMFSDTWETDGVSNSIKRARMGLEAQGHKVYLFASSSGKVGWHGDDYFFKGYAFPFYPTYRLSFMPKDISKDILEREIDVIHVHTPAFVGVKGMLASFRLKIPSVFTYHTDFLQALGVYVSVLPPKTLRKAGMVFLNYLLQDFNAIVFPSEYTRKTTDSWLKVEGKRFVFPTGIDLAKFHVEPGNGKCLPEEVEKARTDGKKIILTVGRVAPEKNLELIFKAMKVLDDDYILFVAGKGPYLKYCKATYESEKIRFLGFVPDFDLPLLYSVADCFVIASKFDTQGMVIHEAMACGTPVAAINYGAMPEFVDDDCGRLFLGENAPAVAMAIWEVCHERKYLGEMARKHVVRNDIDVFVKNLETVYKAVVEQKV
jgi:glycosyltransferase involved in cell wall biosynthesis